jgi:hypothetical protein
MYDQRDAGHLSLPEITRELREVLRVPELTEAGAMRRGMRVLGEPDPVLAPLAARLSRGRAADPDDEYQRCALAGGARPP